MNKLLTFAAVTVASSFASFTANAGTLDFVAYAAGNEHGINSGDSVVIDGNDITLNSNFSPYFDDLSGGLPAGLGVCRELDDGAGSECANSGDDSIDGDFGIGEWVEIVFNTPFSVKGLSFTDGDHNDLNSSMGNLLINGVSYTFAGAVAAAASGTFSGLASIRFDYVDTEFYINSISDVPIPGAIPLLLSGLAGLGFAGRRRKTS